MEGGGLSTGVASLRAAAVAYFSALYQNPTIHDSEVDAALGWQPTFHFRINDYLTVMVEVSEKPYPMIFSLRRVEVEQLPIPVSIYSVCPEEAYLDDQAESKRLMSHGYGLLTVDASGFVQKRNGCIPIIQQISDQEFKSEIKELPVKIRQRLAESFERYNQNAPTGATDISEVLEGFIIKAAKEGVAKAWIVNSDTGTIAKTLQAMSTTAQFDGAAAAIGATRGYISMYRNANHHFPKNRKQAAIKYRDCRHAFLDGLKKVIQFRQAMKNIGLSGGF
jgi:hypothetical protein